jgi:hypothetical protein
MFLLLHPKVLTKKNVTDFRSVIYYYTYTICPADNATAGSLGRRRAGQLRFGFVAVSAGHIVYYYIIYIQISQKYSLFK